MKLSILVWILASLALTSLPAFAQTYAYDAAGRLTSVDYGGGVVTTYTYDPGGNITQIETTAGGGPTIYCTAKVNSAGCAPSVGFSGSPSASAGSGFSITATNVLDNKFGLLFYSLTGAQAAPFQGGILCAKPPHVRTDIQSSGSGSSPGCQGTSGSTGSFDFDFNAYIASGKDPSLTPANAAGKTVNAQFWSRDPGFAPPNNTNLTDAVEFTIGP
jgi:YD repeat-containing protein